MSRIIDPRAKLVCNLGVVASGGTARDKVQDRWLLRYSGNLEIAGNIAPPVGTRVELAYLWRGGLTRFPVRHYVLSAAATAFGRMTTVRIGCRLNLLGDRRPLEPFRAADYPPQWYLDLPPEDRFFVTPPITAQGLLEWCAEGMGMTIAPGSHRLVGNLLRPDVSAREGYASLLADLLKSHGCIGYVDAGDRLAVKKVSLEAGPGPIFDRHYLIELSPVGGGNQAAERVSVRYRFARIWNSSGVLPPEGVVPSASILAESVGPPRIVAPDPAPVFEPFSLTPLNSGFARPGPPGTSPGGNF
jgi:hypothetical protein